MFLQPPDDSRWGEIECAFRTRGFGRIPSLLSQRGLQVLSAEIDRLEESHDANSLFGRVTNDRGESLVLNHLDKESDLLFDLTRDPIMLSCASALTGRPCIPLHVECFIKPVGCLQTSPSHQDQVFYEEHFQDELALTLWIPLRDVELDTAPLELAPGAWRDLLPHERSRCPAFDWELRSEDGLHFEPVCVPAGDALAFHAYVPHRAGVNRSTVSRRAVAFNYRTSEYRAYLQRSERGVAG